MKCKHCGNDISWDAKFCDICGGPNEPVSEKLENYATKAKHYARKTKEFSTPYLKRFFALCKKRKWIAPSIVGALLIIIVIGVIFNASKTIDLADYIVTEVSGYEISGNVDVSLDYEKLNKKVLGNEPDKSNKKSYTEYLTYQSNAQIIKFAVNVTMSAEAPLRNGDIFLVTIEVLNKDIFEKFGFEIKDSVMTVPLKIGEDTEKFDELTDINLFDFITLDFSGNNGYGKAEISPKEFEIDVYSANGEEYTLTFAYISSWGNSSFEVYSSRESDMFAMIRVSIENGRNLSNGDKVKILFEHDDGNLANALKINIENREKEFTVSGLK